MIVLNDGYTAMLTALCILVLTVFGWRHELFGKHADIRPVHDEPESWTSIMLASLALAGWFASMYAARNIGLLPLTGIPYEQEWGAALLTVCVIRQPIRQCLALCLGLLTGEAAGRSILLESTTVLHAAALLDTLLLSFLLARGITVILAFMTVSRKKT